MRTRLFASEKSVKRKYGGHPKYFRRTAARRDVTNLFDATQYTVIACKDGFIIEVD